MTKTLSIALAVTLALGALGLAAGCRGHHRGDPARFVTNRVEDLLDDVKATDAQRQQIRAIRDKLLADGKALHTGHAELHKQLLAQWQSNSPDAAAVHTLVDARAAEMKRFADEVVDGILRVHAVLTPEQRAIVTKKLQRHMEE